MRHIGGGVLVALLVFGSLGLLIGDFGSPGPHPLVVATNIWPGYEPLYLARGLEAWSDEEIRLVECSSATQALRLFRNGDIDAAALTLDEALLLRQDGIDARVFLVLDISHGADAILAQPDIADFASLQGRRVGFESTALGSYVLTRACELHHIDPATIEFIPLEINEHERAFLEGRLDGVVTFEPVRSRLLDQGANVVFDSRAIPNEIVDVLVARGDVFEDHAEQLDLLARGWLLALDHIQTRPRDAAERMSRRLALSPEAVLEALTGLRLADAEINQRLLGGPDPELLTTAQTLASVMLTRNLLHQRPPLNALIEPSIIHRWSSPPP